MGLEQKSNLPSSKDMQVVGFAMPRRKPDGSPAPDRIRKPDIRPVPDEDTVEQEPVDIQTAARPPFAIDTPVNTQAPARAGTTTLPRPTTPAEIPSFPDTRAKDKGKQPPKPPTSLKKRIALWGSALAITVGTLIVGGIFAKNKFGGDSTPDTAKPGAVVKLETFDPNAEKPVLKAGVNSIRATEEQKQQSLNAPLEEISKDKLPTISWILPKTLSSGQTVEVKTAYSGNSVNPITGESGNKIPWGITLNYNKNEDVRIPIQQGIATMEVFLQDPNIGGVFLRYVSPHATYGIFIQGDRATDLSPLADIKDAPIVDKQGKVLKTTKGLVLPADASILISTTDNANITFIEGVYTEDFPRGLPAKITVKADDSQHGLYS